jgi:AmiR/NasT family two-component response regulator
MAPLLRVRWTLGGRIMTEAAAVKAQDSGAQAVDPTVLRLLVGERRAGAQSELATRLKSLGYDVVARVTSGRAAVEYAQLLAPDAVLLAPQLGDGPGLAAAIAVVRARPGIAALVMNDNPALADPAARPNWGSVAVVPSSGSADDLEASLKAAISCARKAAEQGATAITPTHSTLTNATPATPAETHTATSRTPVVNRAVEALARRENLPVDEAMALMRKEANETGQSLDDIARAVLGEGQLSEVVA